MNKSRQNSAYPCHAGPQYARWLGGRPKAHQWCELCAFFRRPIAGQHAAGPHERHSTPGRRAWTELRFPAAAGRGDPSERYASPSPRPHPHAHPCPDPTLVLTTALALATSSAPRYPPRLTTPSPGGPGCGPASCGRPTGSPAAAGRLLLWLLLTCSCLRSTWPATGGRGPAAWPSPAVLPDLPACHGGFPSVIGVLYSLLPLLSVSTAL